MKAFALVLSSLIAIAACSPAQQAQDASEAKAFARAVLGDAQRFCVSDASQAAVETVTTMSPTEDATLAALCEIIRTTKASDASSGG